MIDGQTTFTKKDGTTSTAATVSLAFDGIDVTVKTTKTTNADTGAVALTIPGLDLMSPPAAPAPS